MILTTKRLLLREFTESDWHAVLPYQNDPAFLRYNPWTYRTELDVKAFVQMFIEWSQEQPRKKFQVAIILQENGQLIGNCGVRMQSPYAHMAEIGYELDRQYWGHGYATEAAQELLAFGFQELRLHRIWAHCIVENVGSAHVLEKIGMRYEGCLCESEWMKNHWWDTSLYAILDHEWQERQQRLRSSL